MKALIVLPDNFDEIEAFTVIDILGRAGIEITKAGINSKLVTSWHSVKVMTDKTIAEVDASYDMLLLPGGPGYKNLLNSAAVLKLVKDFNKQNKIIGAICAAPVVLAEAGILDNKIAVVCDGMESKIPKVREAKVIASGNVVTSKGPMTAMEFAFMLVERSLGKKDAAKLRGKMM